ncbi:hypothetical protein [Nitrospira sp. M1]
MKRLLSLGMQEGDMTTEEWWASRHRTQRGSVFIRSGKPSKIQNAGLMQCAQCGSEVKILVSPRRNPHSSKLGRAVSMKDHDLCRRCWRRLLQKEPRGVVIDLELARRAKSQNSTHQTTSKDSKGFPPRAS